MTKDAPTASTKSPPSALDPRLAPRVVYEDANVLVIEKPAGLLSQGDESGDAHLVDWARAHVGREYVGLVHRLDRNTSGLMVLGKRTKAADRLSEALRDGRLERRYQAWCLGSFKATKPVEWRHHLLKNERTNEVSAVAANTPGARLAVLKARKLSERPYRGQTVSLIEFSLETGRSHQIRAQAAEMGFPPLGDRKYGGRQSAGLCPRPALHSCYLRFPHPIGGAVHEFASDIPTLEELEQTKF